MQIKLLTLDSSDWTLEQQLRKISEEHHEVLRAVEFNTVYLAEETIDLMQSCKTFLEMLPSYDVLKANENHIAKLQLRALQGKIKLLRRMNHD